MAELGAHSLGVDPQLTSPAKVTPPKRDASDSEVAACIERLRHPEFDAVEVTQERKHRDMPIIPHAFQGNDMTGRTVVLLDPVAALTHDPFAIHEAMHEDGDSVSRLLHCR
jgi:hypothetical protein